MNLSEFFIANFSDEEPFSAAVMLAIIFLISYDFYHLMFSAVLSFIKKDK